MMRPQPETQEGKTQLANDLARDAVNEEMARSRALNRSPGSLQAPALPEPKAPRLPEGFGGRMRTLVGEVEARGLPLDRNALLARGTGEFERLLQLDQVLRREQRLIGPRVDPTRFESIAETFQRAGSFRTPLKAPATSQEFSGAGRAFHFYSSIRSFDDLWKAAPHEPRVIRELYDYRDCLESLVFARSLLGATSEDGRVHHWFFSDPSRSDPVRYRALAAWPRNCCASGCLVLQLVNPLPTLTAWLTGDRALASALSEVEPLERQLAAEMSGRRQPTAEDLRLASAILSAFVSGCDCQNDRGEHLASWERVGAATRRPIDLAFLAGWRKKLAQRFPRTAGFWTEQTEAFYRQVGSDYRAYHVFDFERFQNWAQELVNNRRLLLIALAALAMAEVTPNLVAVLPNEILVEVEESEDRAALSDAIRFKVAQQLSTAFPSSNFKIKLT